MRSICIPLLGLLLICHHVHGQNVAYCIGNSLTNDSRPQYLEDSLWHVYCGKNLDYIFNNPQGHCISTSTPWPDALSDNQFEYISVQPFNGTTLEQDRDIIAYWMTLQPQAKFVIHSGWTAHATFVDDYLAGNPDNMMRPSPEYMQDLIAALNEIFPDRLIIQTHANDLLYSVWQEIEMANNPKIIDLEPKWFVQLPYDELSDIYRDPVHLDLDAGRYLMHNALRYAFGQPLFPRELFPNLTGIETTYIEYVIRESLVIPGDANRDRIVNLADVEPFVDSLTSDEFEITTDMNEDREINLLDIGPFIDAVLKSP